MSRGRCAGCGHEDASCKKMTAHVIACEDYAQLYKTNPAAALSPEKEYERYQLEENTDEHKAERRDQRITKIKADADARLAAQRSRWTGK